MKINQKNLIIVMSVLVLTSTAAWGQSSPASPQLQSLQKCTLIQIDSERLACYDTAIGQLNSAVETGDVMIVDKQAVQTVKKDAFGLKLPSLSAIGSIFKSSEKDGSADDISDVILTLEKMESFGYKRNRFHFSNGQVWVQNEPMKISKPRTKDGVKPTALIEKAALGSFTLRINGKGKKIKVKRVE